MTSRFFFSIRCAAPILLHIICCSWAAPLLDHSVEDLSSPYALPPIRRRQSPGSYEVVTGITAFGVQPRLEIRQLERNVDQWNVYLLGLARFQAIDQTEKLSYYSIAGIHGRPFEAWDGVEPAPGVSSPGYCKHVSNIFGTWHRPYLALFEQLLYSHIVDAVNAFPAGEVRQRYASAALGWRAPYWDWAATPPDGQPVFPTSLTFPTVNVTLPNGTATIPNPLYQYNFHPVNATAFYFNPYASWNTTMRAPTAESAVATSNQTAVMQSFSNSQSYLQNRLYNLFVNYNNFSEFTNEAWITSSQNATADSIESIHDIIHYLVGVNGHMAFFDYSAFDPAFWLHHAMIDRCIAMWQAIYPETFVEPMNSLLQTYDIPYNTLVTSATPLRPFHSDQNGNFWTSDSVRSINTFGYTYTDIGNGSASAIKSAINRLYGSGSGGIAKRSLTKRGDPDDFKSEAQVPGSVDSQGRYIEYLANIASEKMTLNGSYAVYVFLGDSEDDPSTWPTSPSLVGTHAIFASLSVPNPAESPHAAGSVVVTGSVPLTAALVAKYQAGELPCLNVDDVTAYLRKELYWRISTATGETVPAELVAELAVTVVSAEIQPASSASEFPVWGDYIVLSNVTEGKPGGSS